jgi:hypothetical protein
MNDESEYEIVKFSELTSEKDGWREEGATGADFLLRSAFHMSS